MNLWERHFPEYGERSIGLFLQISAMAAGDISRTGKRIHRWPGGTNTLPRPIPSCRHPLTADKPISQSDTIQNPHKSQGSREDFLFFAVA
jgi:hypothetical protein